MSKPTAAKRRLLGGDKSPWTVKRKHVSRRKALPCGEYGGLLRRCGEKAKALCRVRRTVFFPFLVPARKLRRKFWQSPNVTCFSFRAFRFARRCLDAYGQRQRKEQQRQSGDHPNGSAFSNAGRDLGKEAVRRAQRSCLPSSSGSLVRPASPIGPKADGTKAFSFPPLRRRLFFGKTKKSGGREIYRQTASPYSAQVLLPVIFTSTNWPMRDLSPFRRTRRLPSVRDARGNAGSSLSPSTSTRTVSPT